MEHKTHTFADELNDRAWPAFLSKTHIRRPAILAAVAITLGIHYLLGSNARLAAAYVAPILAIAFYDGYVWGVCLGLSVIVIRLGMRFFWPPATWPWSTDLINGAINVFFVFLLCRWADRAGHLAREVRLLRGLLPVCMYCHRIRNAQDQWDRFEFYIADQSEADFTHGICPNCKVHTGA